jgi:hypothetical protein
MYAKLIIPLDPQQLLVIPRSAVLRVGQLDMVEVSDGKHLWRRAVQLGRDLTIDQRAVVQVISGLDEGEQVADHPGAEPAAKGERASANG